MSNSEVATDSFSVHSREWKWCHVRTRKCRLLVFALILVAVVVCISTVAFIVVKSNCISSDSSESVVKMQVQRISRWMNSSTDRCNDFYGYVCGNFASHNKLPSLSTVHRVPDILKGQIRTLLVNKLSKSDHKLQAAELASTFYTECTREKVNGNRLRLFMNKMSQSNSLETLLAKSLVYMDSSFVKLTVRRNPFRGRNNSSSPFALWIDRGDFILSPELLTSDEEIVTSYRETLRIQSINSLTREHKYSVDDAMKLEIDLAHLVTSTATTSGTVTEGHLQLETLSSLVHFSTRINWTQVMLKVADEAHGSQLSVDTTVVLSDASYIRSLDVIFSRYTDQVITVFLLLRFISVYGFSFANHDFSDFEYMSKASLSPSSYNRSDRCVDLLIHSVPLVAGRLFLEQWTDKPNEKATEKVHQMTNQISRVLVNRLSENTWLSSEVKNKLMHKINSIKVQISHPGWIFNDTLMDAMFPLDTLQEAARTKDGGDSIIKLKQVTLANQLNKLSGMSGGEPRGGGGGGGGEEDTSSDWVISPASVEVNYDSLSNTLTIPAGCLDALYFHPVQPDYINYAGLGVSIARAFISALSPLSLQFDETGVFIGRQQFPATFWTDLHEKSHCYADQYVTRYTSREEDEENDPHEERVRKVAAHASRTLNETVNDVQAFQLMYESLKNISADVSSEQERATVTLEDANVTLTIDQLFTVLYESNFCQTSTVEWLQIEQLVSPFLPARERSDVVLSNCPQLVSSFNCTRREESHLQVDKCSVW